MTANEITALIDRLEKTTEPDNALDVQIEVALFDPDVSVRANVAGTKVIYTKRSGLQTTYRAEDYTFSRFSRTRALALLRALKREGERQ